MSAINMPAAPVKALFMNVLRDRKLSSGSIMGCRLSQCQCAQTRKVFNLSEKRAKCWTTLISTTSKAWKIRRLKNGRMALEEIGASMSRALRDRRARNTDRALRLSRRIKDRHSALGLNSPASFNSED